MLSFPIVQVSNQMDSYNAASRSYFFYSPENNYYEISPRVFDVSISYAIYIFHHSNGMVDDHNLEILNINRSQISKSEKIHKKPHVNSRTIGYGIFLG